MSPEIVHLHMPYGSFGDQVCFLGAARIFALRHPRAKVYVDCLEDVVAAYGDDLLTSVNSLPPGAKPRRIVAAATDRHRVKHASPDRNYVGTYLASLGESVTAGGPGPYCHLPRLSTPPGLAHGRYIAFQPYSTFARNNADRDAYCQALLDACRAAFPDFPIYCIGRPDTRRDLKGLSYDYLGWPKDSLALIQHAALVLTPRSASAHIAAAYRIPTFIWVPGDGEDWHLDYPDWPHVRVSVDLSPADAAWQLKEKGTRLMGDVARVLAETPGNLQSLCHDRLVLECCENIHFHWRNLRIESSISDAARFLDIFWWGSAKIMGALKGKVVTIPLAAICPYNNSHRRVTDDPLTGFENESPQATEEHRAGVKWTMKQIETWQRIRPIAIRPAWHGRFPRPQDKQAGNIWQRLDGFKRYMAHKALGHQTIDCFIIDEDKPGCQDGQPTILRPGEQFERGFLPENFTETGKDVLSLIDADKQRFGKNGVELLRNGLIHLHLGDVRLEFTQDEYKRFAAMVAEGASNL